MEGRYPALVGLIATIRRFAVRPSPRSPVLAYSYQRYSSAAQSDGDSIRRQTALREGWLKRNPDVRLDDTLKLVDAGVSGFTGEHRTDKKHSLARFVDEVRRGRVPAGSHLLVENLDRLTRENPVESIPAVLELIRLGVRVVQLAPSEVVYDADMDQPRLMYMLMELARGHGESKRKSGLCGEVWRQKKAEARASRKPHGPSVPGWIELRNGKYRLKKKAAETVRLIYKWSAEGVGILSITQRLNEAKVRPIGRSGRWVKSYVAKILNSRATLGEYQPCSGERSRVLDGDPIEGYFPAVVTVAEWAAARNARKARTGKTGRPPKVRSAHLFAGLLVDALDGCRMHVATRKGQKLLVSSKNTNNDADARWRPFYLEVFTNAVLGELRELKASDLFTDPTAGELGRRVEELAGVERRLAVAVGRFDADPENSTWADQVTRYDKARRELVATIAALRQQAATPISATWTEALVLMGQSEPERLRAALLATINEIRVLTAAADKTRMAAVQVFFVGGAVRNYLITHHPYAKTPRKVVTSSWREEWAAHLGGPMLDLRNPKHAAALEKDLATHGGLKLSPPAG
jgi:DNA invertase Pin-like site-specific DNA recombinase